jgi:hypothetical protein
MADRVKRLREIADAIARGDRSELTMRVPAEPDRDADLVVSWAADEIERLRNELAEAKEARDKAFATWKKLHNDTLNGYIRQEVEPLRRELAEARWLLNHAVTRETVTEWTQRRDAFLAADQPDAAQLWKPYRIGGEYGYWQCATPSGPYNFQAADEAAAIAVCKREKAAHQPPVAKVGCEREDGTLNIHAETETCEVCQPTITVRESPLLREGQMMMTAHPTAPAGASLVQCCREAAQGRRCCG